MIYFYCITILLFLVYFVSFWKLFIKENIKPYLVFIPFVNFYYLFKICKIPFWTFFIPIVNVVSFITIPYNLSKQYRLKRWQRTLSLFFPFIFIPFVSFSKLENKDKIYNTIFLKNQNDVDILEKKLENGSNTPLLYNDDNVTSGNNIINESSTDNLIRQVEDNVVLDELVYDEIIEPQINNQIINNDEITDVYVFDDDDKINNLSLSNINEVEDKLIVNNNIEKQVETNIKDYETIGPSSESIAFGGEKKIEEVAKAVHEDLKCPRCGSSLIGAKGFCPGCGAPIDN